MSKMKSIERKIVCVTGASGIVGRRIVARLMDAGWRVRALTRRGAAYDARVVVFKGDICDAEVLVEFVRDADALYHCAAELSDASVMWNVNVEGTQNVVNAVSKSGVTYFCFISSAGVVGNVTERIVDEATVCRPYNLYEKSKWAAENIVAKGIDGCRVAILRPTNVVGEGKLGAMSLAAGGLKNRLKLFVKGGECAHIVHADDVAAAAIYLMNLKSETLQCYFVSCDEEPLNTYAGVNAMYVAYRNGISFDRRRVPVHLPVCVAHAVRRLVRGKRNRGDVCYSSKKLLSTGFSFSNGLEGAVRRIAEVGA